MATRTFTGKDSDGVFYDNVYFLEEVQDKDYSHILKVSTIYQTVVLFVDLILEYGIVEIKNAFIEENKEKVECDVSEAMVLIQKSDFVNFFETLFPS